MKEQVRKVLGPFDPARGMPIGSGDAEAVLQQSLRDITPDNVLEPVPRRSRAPRLAVVSAAAAVLVILGAAVVVRSPGGAPAPVTSGATSGGPVLVIDPGAACLTAIADHIQPTSYDGRTGRYEYVHGLGHVGASTQTKGRRLVTALFTEERWWWYSPDGSARSRSDIRDIRYADAASRAYYAQHPTELPPTGMKTTDYPRDPGAYTLPTTDPAAMRRALYPASDSGPAQALESVTRLNLDRVLDAAHRAAVLRFLAGLDGVTCRGEMADDQGRSGVVVSAARRNSPGVGAPEEVDLLFDPRTGELLAATSAVGTKLGVSGWATVFLERGYTDSLG